MNGYLVMALISSFTQIVNQTRSTRLQNTIAERNRQLAEQQEQLRQDFQLDMAEKNAVLQRELALENHKYRLMEQAENFRKAEESVQWNALIQSWPLTSLPKPMRENQIDSASDSVKLRVILCDGDNGFRPLYPEIENQLDEFILTYGRLGCNRLIFTRGIKDGQTDIGRHSENIFYALRDLPTILIDCRIKNGMVHVGAEIWGFGNQRSRETVFRIPFQPKLREDGKIDPECIKEWQDKTAAHLKTLVGYVFDAYNLITYNAPPMLPRVAAEERKSGTGGAVPYAELLRDNYARLYAEYLGSGDKPCLAENAESFQSQILHEIRLDYALAADDYLTDDAFIRCLDESLAAWTALRSEEKAGDFVGELIGDPSRIAKYVSGSDRDYLLRLSAAYEKKGNTSLVPLRDAVAASADALSPGGSALSVVSRPDHKSEPALPQVKDKKQKEVFSLI